MENKEKPKTAIESFWEKNALWLIGGGLLCLLIVFLPAVLHWASSSVSEYAQLKEAWKKV
jgi:predicted negative regulator of RcsB-dependent stress response